MHLYGFRVMQCDWTAAIAACEASRKVLRDGDTFGARELAMAEDWLFLETRCVPWSRTQPRQGVASTRFGLWHDSIEFWQQVHSMMLYTPDAWRSLDNEVWLIVTEALLVRARGGSAIAVLCLHRLVVVHWEASDPGVGLMGGSLQSALRKFYGDLEDVEPTMCAMVRWIPSDASNYRALCDFYHGTRVLRNGSPAHRLMRIRLQV
jgi:hypothetical protein